MVSCLETAGQIDFRTFEDVTFTEHVVNPRGVVGEAMCDACGLRWIAVSRDAGRLPTRTRAMRYQ